uniref:DUF4806 domain-containing protein n=1 Tax=Mastacembelus armatus TaxID=205130 RepID=A0A3Q3N906_9TELE
MDSPSFHVVDFLGRGEVEVVSSLWMAGDNSCYWPPYTFYNQIRRAQLKHEKPGSDWEKYKVRSLYQTCKPNSRYQEYQQSTDEEDIITPHRPSRPIPPTPPTPQAPPALLDPPISPTQTNPPTPPPPPRNSSRASSSAPTLSARPVISCKCCKKQLKEVSVIKQLLMTLTNRNTTAAILPEGIHLPLSSLCDIEVVQGRLKEQACYNDMVKYLSAIGGSNPTSTTRRVMVRMVTTPLAQQLCWRGSGQKLAFGDMLVCKAVIGTVCNDHQSCSAKDFHPCVTLSHHLHFCQTP